MITDVYQAMALWAVMNAAFDAWLIRMNRPINHDPRFIVRLLFAVAYVLLVWHAFDCAMRYLLPMLLGAGAVFTITFRFALNLLLQNPPAYISTSNAYDRRWMDIAKRLDRPGVEGGYPAYLAEAALALTCSITYWLI